MGWAAAPGAGQREEAGRQAELVSGAGLSYLLKQASLPGCSESVALSVCTASHPPPHPPLELAESWASFPGLSAFDSAPSLPTAELAQEHLGKLHQVSSWLWVGTGRAEHWYRRSAKPRLDPCGV